MRVNRNIKEIVICRKKHELYSMSYIKTALSASDDKVYICDDDIRTFNFGCKGEKKINKNYHINSMYDRLRIIRIFI